MTTYNRCGPTCEKEDCGDCPWMLRVEAEGPKRADKARCVEAKCGATACTDCFPAQATLPENPKAIHGRAKPSLSLIPGAAQVQVAGVFALGAEKYGPYNWRKDAVEAETYVSAAQRHLFAWFDGEDTDPESGELHLAHAAACLLILLDASSCGKMIDNRPHTGATAALIRSKTKPIEGKSA